MKEWVNSAGFAELYYQVFAKYLDGTPWARKKLVKMGSSEEKL
jgi:hypothetical protein